MSPKTIRGFAVVYAILFVVLIGSGLGAWAAYNVRAVQAQVAKVKSDIGNTDVVKAAEANIQSSATTNGITISSQTITKIVPDPTDPNVVYVYDTVRTVEAGTIKLKLTVSKGVWQVTGAVQTA